MSLISNISSRLGDHYIVQSAGQFFNTTTKKAAIVFIAVAVIIALGVYLLRAGDCLRRFRATPPTPPPSEPNPSRVPPAPDETLYQVPPNHVFERGVQRSMTHYKRSDALEGWVLIRANLEGNILSRMFSPFDPEINPGKINDDILRDEVPSLDGCISAQEVESRLTEASRLEETSQFLMPDTRASKVPAHVFAEGERLRVTHYLHLHVSRPFVDDAGMFFRSGWILINDSELTSFFIANGPDNAAATPCPYPTDTTGAITAEEVRACRPTGSWMDRRDNQTNIPPEFILAFGEEHGATCYKYQLSHNCWHVFCGEKCYAFKRNGTFAQIPGRETPPQANEWLDPENFFTAEQVKAHYEQIRPRQPENRSSIVPSCFNGSCRKLIPVTCLHVHTRVAGFGENCHASHYQSIEDGWVIYSGESQSYVYRVDRPDEGFSRQAGQSLEVLNQMVESDPGNFFTSEQVRNDHKCQSGLIPDY